MFSEPQTSEKQQNPHADVQAGSGAPEESEKIGLISGLKGLDLARSVLEAFHAKIASGEVKVDWNGHLKDGSDLNRMSKERVAFLWSDLRLSWVMTPSAAQTLRDSLSSGAPLEKPLVLGTGGIACGCPHCGNDLHFETDGKEVRVSNPCPSPAGVYPIEVELNVPSGKIVFANDLRECFPILGEYDINIDAGQAKTTAKYAEFGMAHCFVGNSSPGIFRVQDGEITVSTLADDERWNDDTERYETVPAEEVQKCMPPGENAGSICTDLWWWCGVDLDEFRKRFGGTDEEFKVMLQDDCIVVDVKPGVYRISHFDPSERDSAPAGGPQHFSKITWLRPADPVEDYRRKLDVNFEAGQILFDMVRSYPSLYFKKEPKLSGADSVNSVFSQDSITRDIRMLAHANSEEFLAAWNWLSRRERMQSLEAAADQIFCVIGNGESWQRNGWPASNPDLASDAPALNIPVFSEGRAWYPMSPGYSAILIAAGMGSADENGGAIKTRCGVAFRECKPLHLNDSFLELAFNVLKCIVRHGVVHSDAFVRAVDRKSDENTVACAKVALVRLAKMYPEAVPEDCKDLVLEHTSSPLREVIDTVLDWGRSVVSRFR